MKHQYSIIKRGQRNEIAEECGHRHDSIVDALKCKSALDGSPLGYLGKIESDAGVPVTEEEIREAAAELSASWPR